MIPGKARGKMKLKHWIYQSEPSSNPQRGPRFSSQVLIQEHLSDICSRWSKYLQTYADHTGRLFKASELPWMGTEGAVVSTLSASIARYFKNSAVIEESRVPKPGRQSVEGAEKATDAGRCDLWVSIPQLAGDFSAFSFYLEAKISQRDWDLRNLGEYLRGRYGINKLFRDYHKSNPKKLDQRSAYRKDRTHDHYIVGLLITRLQGGIVEEAETKRILKEVFEGSLRLDMRGSTRDPEGPARYRFMYRYPTVALIIGDEDEKRPCMVASFTVLGASKRLGTGKDRSAKEE